MPTFFRIVAILVRTLTLIQPFEPWDTVLNIPNITTSMSWAKDCVSLRLARDGSVYNNFVLLWGTPVDGFENHANRRPYMNFFFSLAIICIVFSVFTDDQIFTVVNSVPEADGCLYEKKKMPTQEVFCSFDQNSPRIIPTKILFSGQLGHFVQSKNRFGSCFFSLSPIRCAFPNNPSLLLFSINSDYNKPWLCTTNRVVTKFGLETNDS